MKVLIIEDEQPNIDRLRRLLSKLRPGYSVVGELQSVAEVTAWFSCNAQPDMVLMDIQLRDGLSFDIFNEVRVEAPIIFTTAYDEYAIKAFKYNSIDYLLKPIEEDELNDALAKAERNGAHALAKNLELLMEQFGHRGTRKRFLLPYKDGYKMLQTEEVLYFFSEMKVTTARLRGGKDEIVPSTLDELELQLDNKVFFRANRQYIIHIDAVSHVQHFFNYKLKIILTDRTEVTVSREKASLLKAWMDF